MAQKKSVDPATGSFPGYEYGKDVFTAWMNALQSHASTWNELWSKVKSDGGDVKDWSKAIVNNVETWVNFSEQIVALTPGPTAPPWVSIPYPQKSETPIRIRAKVGSAVDAGSVDLLPLGHAGKSLKATVRSIGPHSIGVVLIGGRPGPGRYLGVVQSREGAPIAVISTTVGKT